MSSLNLKFAGIEGKEKGRLAVGFGDSERRRVKDLIQYPDVLAGRSQIQQAS
jgi:hypothetical protein